jgi:hypothetical protein
VQTLTSHKHEYDGEYFFIVRVGRHVAETHGDKASETEVEGGAVTALKHTRRRVLTRGPHSFPPATVGTEDSSTKQERGPIRKGAGQRWCEERL